MISPLRKRIVVVGAGGRLGKAFVSRYQGEHDVICLNHAALDLADPASIAAILEPLDYDLLILPGALTAVDYCETHQKEAFAVNSLGPKLVAEISAGKGAHVTYISTDFVFDGLSMGPYDERATPNPLSVYGASKLEGEEHVLAASSNHLVVRVSWVYGPAKPAFPEWIIGQALQQAELAPALRRFNAGSVEDLQVLVALGDVGPHQVVRALSEAVRERDVTAPRRPPVRRPGARKADGSQVTVVGVGNLLVQMAKCCQPLPGEAVAGYLTRGRGVSVHRGDCATFLRLVAAQPGRRLDVEGGSAAGGARDHQRNAAARQAAPCVACLAAATDGARHFRFRGCVSAQCERQTRPR